MKRTLLLSGAVTAMLGAAPFAMADNAIVTETDSVQIAQAAAGDIDAGKLVGQEVYDPFNQRTLRFQGRFTC